MSTTTALILLAAFAWILQIIFSGVQIYRFNKAFISMKQGKYIGVGRSQKKYFQPRVLIALSFDSEYTVIDSLIMEGITVFSLPKKLLQLHGKQLSEIDPIALFPNQKRRRDALSIATSVEN